MGRRDDIEDKTYFRSDRLFCSNGQWFFATREGERGPFVSRDDAQAALARFVGEKRDLEDFQTTREAEVRHTERLTTIAKRKEEDANRVEIRRFDNGVDLLL